MQYGVPLSVNILQSIKRYETEIKAEVLSIQCILPCLFDQCPVFRMNEVDNFIERGNKTFIFDAHQVINLKRPMKGLGTGYVFPATDFGNALRFRQSGLTGLHRLNS